MHSEKCIIRPSYCADISIHVQGLLHTWATWHGLALVHTLGGTSPCWMPWAAVMRHSMSWGDGNFRLCYNPMGPPPSPVLRCMTVPRGKSHGWSQVSSAASTKPSPWLLARRAPITAYPLSSHGQCSGKTGSSLPRGSGRPL